MNEINFHSIKNIDVPEELKEKVLTIPDRPSKKSIVYFNRRMRFAVAAACMVIVSVLSAVLFIKLSGNAPVPIQPSPAGGAVSPSDYSSDPSLVPPTEYSGTLSPTATDHPSADPTESVISSTDSPADRSRGGASQQKTVRPSESPSHSQATESGKSDHPADPTPYPADPTSKPDSVPATDTPTQAPWQPPSPPTEVPMLPSEPTWDSPTEEPWKAPTAVSVSIPRNNRPADRKIYCRIESLDGEVFGNFGLFDNKRLMTELGSSGGNYAYYYRFANYYNVPFRSESDTFNCIIYDGNGNVLNTNPIHWL